MNFRNLLMWGLIVLLSVGLFNLFQNPNRVDAQSNKIAFSKFLQEVDNGRVVEVEIQGNGPRFRLRELNVQDYPHIEWAEPTGGIKIFGRDFLPAVSRVGVASATDEARPTLTGVLFESQDDALRLVATDSYRLAVCQIPGSPGVATTLVPFRALRELNRTIGDDNMALNLREREAVFSSPRGALSARVIEADFPNYRQLLPESYPNKIVLDKGSLLEALGRASLVAEEHIPVRLTLHSGGVELSVSRQEVGEETEHLDGVYTGEDMTIAFNTKYLTDGVAAVTSDDVVLEASDPLKPGLITGEGDGSFRYLLMPVRL